MNVIVDLLPNPARSGIVGHGYRVGAEIEDGRARARTLELGARGESTAVAKAGLTKGELVIVYPSDSLEEGSRVEEVVVMRNAR